MKKVLLAVGHSKLEEYLKSNLKPDCMVVGVTTYKEGVYKAVATKNPDILVFRETLPGDEDVLTLIYQIVDNYPSTRIIFLSVDRKPGDKLLETLVNYNVYDIITGQVNAKEIINLARNPNTRADVKHYQLPPNEPRTETTVSYVPPAPLKPIAPVEEPEEADEVPLLAEPEIVRQRPVEPIVKPLVTKREETVIQELAPTEAPVENPIKETVPHEASEASAVEESTQKKAIGIGIPFFQKKNSPTESEKVAPMSNPYAESDTDSTDDVPERSGGFLGGLVKKPKELFKKDYSSLGDDAGGKIVSFIGGRAGVGTTTIALNTAVHLAQKGMRVIYLELDDLNPSVSYWYQLYNMNDGLENVLDMLNEKRFADVENEIIKMSKLRKEDALNYKIFPQTLDFMFYSRRYLTRENLDERILPNFKELFLHLAYQLNYDFVIVDVNANTNRKNKEAAIRYSNKVFSVITQDISSISYYVADLHNLEHKGLRVSNKNFYILNKFNKSSFGLGEIKKWLSTDKVITMASDDKGMIEANYAAIPYILKYRKSNFTDAVGQIAQAVSSRI